MSVIAGAGNRSWPAMVMASSSCAIGRSRPTASLTSSCMAVLSLQTKSSCTLAMFVTVLTRCIFVLDRRSTIELIASLKQGTRGDQNNMQPNSPKSRRWTSDSAPCSREISPQNTASAKTACMRFAAGDHGGICRSGQNLRPPEGSMACKSLFHVERNGFDSRRLHNFLTWMSVES